MISIDEYKKNKKEANRKEMTDIEIALGFKDPDGTTIMTDNMADRFGTPEGFRRETEIDRKRINRIMDTPGSADIMADYLAHLAECFKG